MARKLGHTAEIVGDALGSVSAATTAAGKRVRQGLSEAAAAISSSKTANRIEERLAPAKKVAAKKVDAARKTGKKQVTDATKKAATTKKRAAKKAARNQEGHRAESQPCEEESTPAKKRPRNPPRRPGWQRSGLPRRLPRQRKRRAESHPREEESHPSEETSYESRQEGWHGKEADCAKGHHGEEHAKKRATKTPAEATRKAPARSR